MKLHRFFIDPDNVQMNHDFWLHEQAIVAQWLKVLRYRIGSQVILFDGVQHERLYKITDINNNAVHLTHVTDFVLKKPFKDVYLLFSLLKKDKNNWVLQKGTELGVSHFVPVLAERSEKTGFNLERAQKIIVEAAEQCGRGDIPSVREPLLLETAITELQDKVQLVICESGGEAKDITAEKIGVLVGPEGGWSENEKELVENSKIQQMAISDFTLRAETACIVACAKLLQ